MSAEVRLRGNPPADRIAEWPEDARRALLWQLEPLSYLLWIRDLRTPLLLCRDEARPLHAVFRSIVHGAADAFYAWNVLAGLYAISPEEYLVAYLAGRGSSDRSFASLRAVGEAVANSESLESVRPFVADLSSSILVLYHRIETYSRNMRLDPLPAQRLRKSDAWLECLGTVSGALRTDGGAAALLRKILRGRI